ncbi:hypothetical protein Tco_0089384 [Tanacetum coccineum]
MNVQEDSETDKEESIEAIDVTPVATKSHVVVNWKIFQQGQRSIYQIIRANRANIVSMSFGAMLKDITREDLTKVYKLVMQKYGANRQEDAYDRVFWSDLRTMFEPPLKRKYPLSSDVCQAMLDMKLQGKQNEECYQLLKLIEKQKKDSDVMIIELIKDDENPSEDEIDENDDVGEEVWEGNYFDKFLTRSELAYHKYLMNSSYLSMIESDPIIVRGNPQILRYIALQDTKDSKSPSGINNFIGRVRGTSIFIRNFTYVSDFMVVEDISSVIDPRVSHVVLGKPFVELSNITYDSSIGVVKLTKGEEEIAYKMPHKIEHYDSFSNEEKENMKSVYLGNEEDKRREYVMSKILGFYKECLELRPEYQTGLEESSSGSSETQGGVT